MSRRPARANPEDVVDFPRRRRRSAPKRPKLAQYEIDRLVGLVRALGIEVAALEARPGRMRIITPAGVGLTLGDDEDQLDAEIRSLIQNGQN